MTPIYYGTRGFGLAMAVLSYAWAIGVERELKVKYARRDRYGRPMVDWWPPSPMEREYQRWYVRFLHPDAWLVTL